MNTARTRRAQPTDVPHDDLEEAKNRRPNGVDGTMPFQTHQRNGAGGCWERVLGEDRNTNATTNGPIRVLLADDQTLFREGLAGILASYGGMEVIAEVPNDAEALRL